MTLLDFARGPGFEWALIVMVFGICWRVFGIIILSRGKDLSKPRSKSLLLAGMSTIATRSLPPHEFEKKIRFQHFTGYAWHIGFFITVLLSGPHIAFFKGLLGFGWPGLPTPVITIIAAITLAILLALVVRRLFHPVLRVISGADDYISALVTILPIVTGMMTYAHLLFRYETMLAIHILSVELLMIWFPLGKLMHSFLVFPSRYQIGAKYQRRGVKA